MLDPHTPIFTKDEWQKLHREELKRLHESAKERLTDRIAYVAIPQRDGSTFYAEVSDFQLLSIYSGFTFQRTLSPDEISDSENRE